MRETRKPSLTDSEVAQFIAHGFVRLDAAFPRSLADEARAILWAETGCDPDIPSSWTKPVIRLGMYAQSPFVEAANTARLHSAFDQLVGPHRWLAPQALGTFPVRFPSSESPGDDGWHVDMSFGYENSDFMQWRCNVASKGRALLMLFLFSDVGVDDAPTRIRSGSHLHVARLLAPAGDAGLTLRELMNADFGGSSGCPEQLATGDAGTVYLCHPFLVHAAQAHRGRRPKFMAQPPLLPAAARTAADEGDEAPVAQAIRAALTQQT